MFPKSIQGFMIKVAYINTQRYIAEQKNQGAPFLPDQSAGSPLFDWWQFIVYAAVLTCAATALYYLGQEAMTLIELYRTPPLIPPIPVDLYYTHMFFQPDLIDPEVFINMYIIALRNPDIITMYANLCF